MNYSLKSILLFSVMCALSITLVSCAGIGRKRVEKDKPNLIEKIRQRTKTVAQKEKQLFPARKKGKYGYIDVTGKFVIKAQFDEVDVFSEGLAPVRIGDWKNGRWGYIDKTGNLVINPQFDRAYGFSEGLALVEIGGRYGYIDKTGKYVLNPQVNYHRPFSEGLAAFEILDTMNNPWVKEYGVTLFGDEYIWGYIDKTGMVVINPQFKAVGNFSEGLASVRTGGEDWTNKKHGYINKTGKYIINPQSWYDAEPFSEGLACVGICYGIRSDNVLIMKYGYIDKTGNYVIVPQFDGAHSFSEGLACVMIGGRFGYIDKTGNYVINPQFDGADDFSEGLACVWIGEREVSGYIDKTGKFVINPQFDKSSSFSGGLARVTTMDGQEGYIDKTGKIVYIEE